MPDIWYLPSFNFSTIPDVVIISYSLLPSPGISNHLAEKVGKVGIGGLGLLLAAEHREDRRGEDDQDQHVKADLPASVAFRFQTWVTPYLSGYL